MKAKALLTILSRKYKDGEIVFIDSINFESPKARLAKNFIESLTKIKGFERLGTKKINSAYIAMTKEEFPMKRSFANFGNMEVGDIRNLNPIDIASYKFLFITNPDAAIKTLETKVQQEINQPINKEEKKDQNLATKKESSNKVEDKANKKPEKKTVKKEDMKKDIKSLKKENKQEAKK